MTLPAGNWHDIIGPNGMCRCGVEADGTVVTCGALLLREIPMAPSPVADSPTPLEKAVADRDARPWAYYKLDRDVLIRLLNEQADTIARLKASAPSLSAGAAKKEP